MCTRRLRSTSVPHLFEPFVIPIARVRSSEWSWSTRLVYLAAVHQCLRYQMCANCQSGEHKLRAILLPCDTLVSISLCMHSPSDRSSSRLRYEVSDNLTGVWDECITRYCCVLCSCVVHHCNFTCESRYTTTVWLFAALASSHAHHGSISVGMLF